jgi:hypothetical protein
VERELLLVEKRYDPNTFVVKFSSREMDCLDPAVGVNIGLFNGAGL